jgi:hypothetical protein
MHFGLVMPFVRRATLVSGENHARNFQTVALRENNRYLLNTPKML